MKHVFIVNKISGKGAAYNLRDAIKEVSEEMKLDYEIIVSEYEGHAKEIASSLKKEEVACAYAVGGDGTLLEVLNGLDNNITMGIIPAGSGNDFYRYYGKGKIKEYKTLIKETILADEKVIDVGQSDRMKFLNTSSFGIDAKINLDASHMIRKTILTKGPAYILSILANVIVIKPSHAKLIIDGNEYNDDYLVVAVMNGKYYGNGVPASPEAIVDDGYFDLVVVKAYKGLKVYQLLINYLSGKAPTTKEIDIIRCKNVEIYTDDDVVAQCDGENFVTRKLQYKILENYLKIKISY